MKEFCEGIYWKKFRKQKKTLFLLITNNETISKKQKRHVKGILNLLDALQDTAAGVLSPEKVFGKDKK